MRKVFGYLKDYQRKHFDWKLYSITGLFLVLCFTFNYYFDFEDSVLDRYDGTLWDWFNMFWWMGLPFLGVCLILHFTGKSGNWLRSGHFWLRFFIGFAILALDRSFYAYILLADYLTPMDYYFIAKCVRWSSSLFLTVLPLVMIYLMIEGERPKIYYGLWLKQFDPRPYFVLLGIAAVFIAIGSFFSDIQAYYPRFQYSGGERFAELNGLPVWVTLFIYEFTYGVDFIAVEVFFRGFLIHAFVKTLGGYAVLPMIATYAFLHFGKPLTEAISSVFGGYILGIISFYSRNVWGGIIIHMGVAWIMELFGYLQSLI